MFKLDEKINAGVRAMGYTSPTPVQEETIPPILSGKDVLGLAQTGTGKTAAFVLPILQRILGSPGRSHARALIISPTRELTEQTHQTIGNLGKKAKIKRLQDLPFEKYSGKHRNRPCACIHSHQAPVKDFSSAAGKIRIRSAAALHGDLTQCKRQKALEAFRLGTYKILVATDVAARGIDVRGISHVINYDIPDTALAYTHRIGRTGRA
jgi:superfamily II DNA/RNA helicase